jgi:DNA (cytosine-5)-methyltransferase 1
MGKVFKALDLFCGAGGASKGLADAGFEVTGVDILPQPNYPFKFVLADAMNFPLEGYDFIWASPPCQAFSMAQRIQKNQHPDFISRIRRRLVESGTPWCIENVVGAPLLNPITLCGAMFGLRVYRHRLFETSFEIEQPLHPNHLAPVTKMGRPPKEGEFMHVVGNFSGVKEARAAMKIDWMTRDELRESIPPAYSTFIGLQARLEIKRDAIRPRQFSLY